MTDQDPPGAGLAFRPQAAWWWCGAIAALGAASFALFLLNRHTPLPASWGTTAGPRNGLTDWLNAVQLALLSPVAWGGVGALILSRQPRHRMGRLVMLLGALAAVGQITQEWAVYSIYTAPGQAPGGQMAAWVTNWIWIVLFGLLLLTTALFPNGRLPTAKWRWLVGAPLTAFVGVFLTAALFEARMSSAYQVVSPLSVTLSPAAYAGLYNAGTLLMPITAVMVLASAIARYRDSQSRERLQMKWLLVGIGLMVVLLAGGLALLNLGESRWGGVLLTASVAGPILGVGVALVRHQLFDVDVLIRRTVQWSAISGVLALTYFGLITVLQAAFRSLSNQQSEISIVLSTLAIAALFGPVRGRVQRFIDRRFFRPRYDAERVLAEFAAHVRDETDLNALTGKLAGVVQETMEPESVKVWLKTP